jgi:hypothetical protein
VIGGPLKVSGASSAISISSVVNEDYGKCRDRYAYMNSGMNPIKLTIQGKVEVSTGMSLVQRAPVEGLGVTGPARPFPIVDICFSA